MRNKCLTFFLTAAAVAVAPVGLASASTNPSEAIAGLATESAELLAEEQELVLLLGSTPDAQPVDRAETRVRLSAVDASGSEILGQLDLLGVDLTESIRATLDRLPPAAPGEVARLAPPPVVYDAAIDDLLRIASTPTAVTPATESGGNGQSFGLLAVAALALTVLGVAALANALRPRTSDDELAALAWSDGLTGLANRRRLDADLASSATDIGPMSAIMIDVDHFKAVNDKHGHHIGDEVLRRLAATLADNVRRDDVVYRYGGEEFCIILPGASIEEARRVGHRIVAAARTISLPDGSHITVSVGVADGTGDAVIGTLQSADRALYAAKEHGRDQAMTAAALLTTAAR